MAIAVGFYATGTEADYAGILASYGLPFAVDSATALQPTAVTTTDRTVRINPGAAHVCSIRLTVSAAETVQVATNTSGGIRYDAVVYRTVWGAAFNGQAAGTSVLTVVKGTSSPPGAITTGSPSATAINRLPGTVYDAIVCYVGVPNNVATLNNSNLFDLRLVGGIAGSAQFQGVTSYTGTDAPVGAEIRLLGTSNFYRKEANGSWLFINPQAAITPFVPGTAAGTSIKLIYATVTMGATDANGACTSPTIDASYGLSVIDNVSITDVTPTNVGGWVGWKWLPEGRADRVAAIAYGFNSSASPPSVVPLANYGSGLRISYSLQGR